MKIVFDASIHLGQFSLDSQDMRVACKNSQVRISAKGSADVVGVVTFEENSWVDHIIWQLKREQQDAFYPFMDVFHTVKNIERMPLTPDMLNGARDWSFKGWVIEKPGYEVSNALTRAAADLAKADEIHTCYPDLLRSRETGSPTRVMLPRSGFELTYPEPGLEENYQMALKRLREDGIDLFQMLMQQKK